MWKNKKDRNSNKKLTQPEIDDLVKFVKVVMVIEGLQPSKFAEEISSRYLNDEITSDEAIELIRQYKMEIDNGKT